MPARGQFCCVTATRARVVLHASPILDSINLCTGQKVREVCGTPSGTHKLEATRTSIISISRVREKVDMGPGQEVERSLWVPKQSVPGPVFFASSRDHQIIGDAVPTFRAEQKVPNHAS